MKTLLLVVLGVMLVHSPAPAESIYLSATPDAGVCGLFMPAFSVATVYVVHALSPGAKGSSWRIDNSAADVIALTSSCAPLSIQGDPFTGITLNYGSCQTGTFVICQLTYFKITGSLIPGCYHLNAREFPGPVIEAVACDDSVRPMGGGYFTFDHFVGDKWWMCDDCATATEPATWGKVKALYR